MKKTILIFVAFYYSLNTCFVYAQPNFLPAKKILIKARDASTIGFEAFLYSQDRVVSFAKWSLEKYQTEEKIRNFEEDIERGFQELQQSSKSHFSSDDKRLFLKAQNHNWPIEIRDKVARLWLLNFQRESSASVKKELLKRLADFHPEFKPKDEEFMETTLKEWREEIASKASFAWLPNTQWNDFNFLIINGKIYDLSEKLSIPLFDRPVRLSVFSNSFYPIDKIISARDLTEFSPIKEFLASGECTHPIYHPQIQPDIVSIYFSDQCIVEPNIVSEQIKKNEKNSSLNLFRPSSISSSNAPSAFLATTNESKTSKPINTSSSMAKFGLALLSGIGVGLLILALQQNKTKNQNTSIPEMPDSSNSPQNNIYSKTQSPQPMVHQGF